MPRRLTFYSGCVKMKLREIFGEAMKEVINGVFANSCLQNVKLFKYDVTDSTNTRAREYAARGYDGAPAVFMADGQTAGRGRRGRSFDSARGAGLYVSILFKPDNTDPVLITVRAAVAVARALEAVCGLRAGIKWVNDITVGGKKLAGILTEGGFGADGKLDYAVCGIGINTVSRSFPDGLSDIATAIEDETGSAPERDRLAERILLEFFSADGADEVIREYRERSVIIGRRVEVRRLSGEIYRAKAVGITDAGALTVELDSGIREELISAEVSVKNI